MELFKSITDFQQVAEKVQLVESNCTSIYFENSSTQSFDTNGNPTGWVMVINKVKKLLPGENISINQNTGFVDNTVYNISFSNELGGVGSYLGTIIRVNSEPSCKCNK